MTQASKALSYAGATRGAPRYLPPLIVVLEELGSLASSGRSGKRRINAPLPKVDAIGHLT